MRLTFPSETIAKKFCQRIIKAKLVACSQVTKGVDSCYFWNGQLEEVPEFIVLLKSIPALKQNIRAFVLQHHPYECPSILSYSVDSLNPDYSKWIQHSVMSD